MDSISEKTQGEKSNELAARMDYDGNHEPREAEGHDKTKDEY